MPGRTASRSGRSAVWAVGVSDAQWRVLRPGQGVIHCGGGRQLGGDSSSVHCFLPLSTASRRQWHAGAVLASVVQFHPVQGDTEANRARAAAFVQHAAEAGSHIVVLPELFATGPPHPHGDAFGIAEPPAGPTATWLADQALRHHLAVAGTFWEQADGKLRNRLLLAMPDGMTFTYAKRRLDRSERDSLTPGSDSNVADTVLGRLGFSICLDASDAGLAAQLRAAAVQLVLFPHATAATRAFSRTIFAVESHRLPLMSSFAKRVAAPVLAAGLVGPFRAKTLWAGNWMRGSTWVIGADGTVLAGLGFGQEGVATSQVTLVPV